MDNIFKKISNINKTELFEEYLKDNISIEEVILFFDTNNYTEEEIKNLGIVYTPKHISDHIITLVEPTLETSVFEPSVGHGIFIISLLEYIQTKYNLDNYTLWKYFKTQVYVQDLMENNIYEYKEIIELYFKKKNIDIDKNSIKYAWACDTLFSHNNYYDIMIGNPPYIRTKNLGENYLKELRKSYISCSKGNIDIYYAFIEYAHKFSTKSAMITPNSWIFNSSAKALRKKIMEDLVGFFDFKDEQVFPTASIYAAIFIIDKNKKTNDISYQDGKILKKDIIDYSFSFGGVKKNTDKLEFFKVHTPIATLRDKIYINPELDSNTDLIPFLKLSKIKSKIELLNYSSNIIFPYKLDKDKFVIKKETELNPDTLIYLNEQKRELLKRDKGKTTKYDSWFAYGRKQGLNIYSSKNNLILIPGMFKTDFKFFSINVSLLPKIFLFSSGFFIEVSKSDTKQVIEFLNSKDFKEFVSNNGKIWQNNNGKPYYSISSTLIKSLFSF
jgi:hypothetical protein